MSYSDFMKELFKKRSGSLAKSGTESQAVSKSHEINAFLSKVAAIPKTTGEARLIFALDATASREVTWDIASQLQADMFLSAQSLGGLNLQLCFFRGFADFFSSDWRNNAKEIMDIMSQIRCQAGATQIERVLTHAIKEHETQKIKCVVYVGDAMEENIDILAGLAGRLGLLNVPVFMFQERGDVITKKAFLELSRLSGGAYSQFDQTSVEELKELLRAVAVYAAGGFKALQKFSQNSTKEVKLIERQLKS